MTVSREQPIPPGLSASRALRDRRLVQATWAAAAAIAASSIPDFLSAQWRNLPPLFAGLAALGAVLGLVRAGRREAAVGLMLVSLMAMVGLLLWQNGGLRDSALLAFPCLLVLAAMMATRRLYFALFATMVVLIAVVLVANLQGWHVNTLAPLSINTFVDIVAVLFVTCVIAWLMASDMHAALDAVHAQNVQMAAAQERMQMMATHDALTGLPNRSLARDRFEQAAAAARRGEHSVAMLYLDLDNFKNVNDTLGHGSGDALLKQVSDRLATLLRHADTVARLGGDEFLLLVPEVSDGAAVAEIANKVVTGLMAPFDVIGMEIFSGCSLGITMFPADGDDFDSLLKKADIAMYRAKESGRNAFRFWDTEMNASVVEHVELLSAMRAALAHRDFTLSYQPQFDLRTGRLIGAEALIRWRHAELGQISPARFIPLAERSGLIVPIGDWVLQEACTQAQRWRAAGWTDLTISVNVSPVQFKRGSVETSVAQALAESGLPSGNLELELTESLLIQDSLSLIESLASLRRLGVRFAIDDFGTGYSNLAYLKRFEVERLKIDQTFVRRLTDDVQDQAIVRAIVQMAASLNLFTVAEGVEDGATLALLGDLGCQQGQGFHWSPAVPAAEFEKFLAA
ncbi:putative bifunctional diguanylate cyclase/phosphodiesterase [Scleromatobacter humisilvae]|uniref:EAL domain-containing protein n=1 Tax=Scleromatobacter humisilvae TaxID=2897159 RepID=A0A9X1YJX4_9BURK|nr:EAL domain-containing protein [Scleromatobacter humisilvae]MCK9687864.1 EAL domain-containing protein [Scleromatobacter humisilvae]